MISKCTTGCAMAAPFRAGTPHPGCRAQEMMTGVPLETNRWQPGASEPRELAGACVPCRRSAPDTSAQYQVAAEQLPGPQVAAERDHQAPDDRDDRIVTDGAADEQATHRVDHRGERLVLGE